MCLFLCCNLNLTQNGIFRFIMPWVDAAAGVSEPLVATLPQALKPRHSYLTSFFYWLDFVLSAPLACTPCSVSPPTAISHFSRKYFTLTLEPEHEKTPPETAESSVIAPDFCIVSGSVNLLDNRHCRFLSHVLWSTVYSFRIALMEDYFPFFSVTVLFSYLKLFPLEL